MWKRPIRSLSPYVSRVHHSTTSLSAIFICLWNSSKDGDSTIYLSSLYQCCFCEEIFPTINDKLWKGAWEAPSAASWISLGGFQPIIDLCASKWCSRLLTILPMGTSFSSPSLSLAQGLGTYRTTGLPINVWGKEGIKHLCFPQLLSLKIRFSDWNMELY